MQMPGAPSEVRTRSPGVSIILSTVVRQGQVLELPASPPRAPGRVGLGLAAGLSGHRELRPLQMQSRDWPLGSGCSSGLAMSIPNHLDPMAVPQGPHGGCLQLDRRPKPWRVEVALRKWPGRGRAGPHPRTRGTGTSPPQQVLPTSAPLGKKILESGPGAAHANRVQGMI